MVEFGSPSDTVGAAVISSKIWSEITRIHLTISRRDRQDAPWRVYASTVYVVGAVGGNRAPPKEATGGAHAIPLKNRHNHMEPDHFTLEHVTDFEDLITFGYPDLNCDHRHLNCRAALFTTNVMVDVTNDNIIDRLTGSEATISSADTLMTDDDQDGAPAFTSSQYLPYTT